MGKINQIKIWGLQEFLRRTCRSDSFKKRGVIIDEFIDNKHKIAVFIIDFKYKESGQSFYFSYKKDDGFKVSYEREVCWYCYCPRKSDRMFLLSATGKSFYYRYGEDENPSKVSKIKSLTVSESGEVSIVISSEQWEEKLTIGKFRMRTTLEKFIWEEEILPTIIDNKAVTLILPPLNTNKHKEYNDDYDAQEAAITDYLSHIAGYKERLEQLADILSKDTNETFRFNAFQLYWILGFQEKAKELAESNIFFSEEYSKELLNKLLNYNKFRFYCPDYSTSGEHSKEEKEKIYRTLSEKGLT